MSELLTKLGGAGIAAGAGYLGMTAGQGALSDLQTQATQQIQGVRGGIAGAGDFKPYAVTSGAGSVSYDAQGNPTYGQTAQQMALQNQATGLLGNVGQGVAGLGNLGEQSFIQSQNALTQAGMVDPSIAGQRAAMGGLFGQQLGNYGQPQQALQGFTGAALGGAEGLLSGQANTADVDALRQQYAGLASQAAQGLGQDQASNASMYYNAMQAATAGEREREALALENRLFAQGRGGVQTAAYGGTPEQLAMAKAQEEARSSNFLQASEMADRLATSNQARAIQLGAQTGALAGTSSDLQGQQISQGSQLAGLGLAGTQAQQAMTAQQLQSLAGLQGQDIGAAQAQQALQAGSLGQAQSLFGMGQQASALPSALDAQNIQNMAGLFGASDMQTQQLLAQNAQALQAAQLGQTGSLQEMNALANLGVSELGMLQELGLGGASLTQEYIKSLGNIGAGVAGISLKP